MEGSTKRAAGRTNPVLSLLVGLLYVASWFYGVAFFQVAFAHGDVGSGLPLFLLALGVILYVHRRRHWPPFALRR